MITPFDFSGVRLGESPFNDQFERMKEYFLAVPNNDILRGFRERAGLAAPGSDLGGWYNADIPWPSSLKHRPTTLANPFGQWIGAFSRMYKATGDARILSKVDYLLHEWAKTIDDDGYFFSGDNPAITHYDYEKMIGGLADAYEYAGIDHALVHAERITAWARAHLSRRRLAATTDYPGGGDWIGGAVSDVEWYTLPENLYRLYLLTGDQGYRDFARLWHYDSYWGELARNNPHCMTGLHAYSHINTLSSAAMAYAVSHDRSLLDAIVNAYDIMQESQWMATGGYGPGERLANQFGSLGESLQAQRDTFETPCGSWAGFKLSRYLITHTGGAKYGDWIERLLYNGIGAALPMGERGRTFYYADYRPGGGKKEYYYEGLVPGNPNLQFTAWPCCSGTYPLAVTDYHNIIYFKDDTSLYVNLYVPSRVDWNVNGTETTVVQDTDFPRSGVVTVQVGVARPVTFALQFRVPGWATNDISVNVNGNAFPIQWQPGTWGKIERVWHDQDRVTVDFHPQLYCIPIDKQHPDLVAVMYGPVTLVATNGRALGLDLAAPSRGLARAASESLVFHTTEEGDRRELRPFYSVAEGEPYHMYHDLTNTAGD